MRVVLRSLVLSCLCFIGSSLILASPQASSKETRLTLKEAREALNAEPGNESARKAFTSALRKEITTARQEGDNGKAIMLVEEYIAQLDLRLSTDPTNITRRWTRFNVLRIKYQIAFQEEQDFSKALEAIRAAEKDIRFLAAAKPNIRRYREELSHTLALIGGSTRDSSDHSVPNAAYREAVELARSILLEDPKNRRASFALAYGLWWNAGFEVTEKKTYEAYEASISLYEETVLAFKKLIELGNADKKYVGDRSLVWYQFGQTYRELGDDVEAFKAFRLSHQILQDLSDDYPNDAILHRRAYLFGLYISDFLSIGEKRLAWLEKMKRTLRDAEAEGRLHADDKRLLAEIDRQILFNRNMQNASGPEERRAIIDAFNY